MQFKMDLGKQRSEKLVFAKCREMRCQAFTNSQTDSTDKPEPPVLP